MTVHPRACGERALYFRHRRAFGGSSPRLRGTPPSPPWNRAPPRFIPAPAGNARPECCRCRAFPVHPRACGERRRAAQVSKARSGSSPRLRGTRQRPVSASAIWRFIPAPAGNATSALPASAQCAVHPRACGERCGAAENGGRTPGSSPRLRGTPFKCRLGCGKFRFIPAPAGNALLATPTGRRMTVHPRACGERAAVIFVGGEFCGSSPRLRGTLLCLHNQHSQSRFIPAPAGNAPVNEAALLRNTVHPRACGERELRVFPVSPSSGSSPRLRGTQRSAQGFASAFLVHPRACGERRASRRTSCAGCGSSPRLRGTPETACTKRTAFRFIPAPAGNARGRPRSPKPRAVHPRACGERPGARRWRRTGSGSSPRLRGTLVKRLMIVEIIRFIPAPAGNAAQFARPRARRAVHPRACGERCGKVSRLGFKSGSSPRLRGTRIPVFPVYGEERFIPAPAGNATICRPKGNSSAVHPRACGERIVNRTRSGQRVGSSPRLRGTRSLGGGRSSCERFIPAPAGNARATLMREFSNAVHPRACGERRLKRCRLPGEVGSSPRLRGTPARTAAPGQTNRFIPAPAGNAHDG